ncbi:YqcC family protein [Vibrio makurazakiensis]|uniref:YqcC family protein n=1 Tax=Vibrio makurazakiensis TaxID=2910250 RepID=UPI003D0DB933
MTAAAQLSSLLEQLEQQMQQAHLWGVTRPSDEALASAQPFAIDTLQPEQWLQWIFVARMQALVVQDQALPKGFSIHPYFSEVWKGQSELVELLNTISSIDEACA